jgi:hypothetical protein
MAVSGFVREPQTKVSFRFLAQIELMKTPAGRPGSAICQRPVSEPLALTVAVKLTDCANADGFTDEVTEVVVFAWRIVMLIGPTVTDAELPATSRQVPVTDWPEPSVDSTVGAGGLPGARPETASLHWKLTVTGE